MKRIMLSCLLLYTSLSFATEPPTHTFTSTADEARYQTLINETRCVVCQGQSIADSNALLANDLREKIYQLITAHQSDAAIKDYLAKRYGEFILLQPRFNKISALLWAFPFLGLGVLFLWGVLFARRQVS